MPLMWAHAEYIKLLRSARDGLVYDRIPAVAERYLALRRPSPLEVWTFRRRARSVRAGTVLRILAGAPFRLHWTADDWSVARDTDSTLTELGISFAEIPVGRHQSPPLRFTFFWPETKRWEGRDFAVDVQK